MGPAEIVASLKELCAEKGPRLGTEEIVAWIERIGGFETNAELVAFAKKMKARQYARMLEYEDEDSGMRIKRLWSFHDQAHGTPVLCRHPRDAGGRAQAVDPPVYPLPQADCAACARRWPTTSPASGFSTSIPTSRKRKRPSSS